MAAAAIAGVQVAGAYGQMVAGEAQANYQKEMADINSREAESNAKRVLKQGGIDAINHKKKINQLVGSQRAGFASQGVEVDFGSARQVQDETMETGLQEVESIRNNAFLTAMGFRAEGDERKRNAAMNVAGAKSAGAQTLLAGGLSAAKTFNENGYFDKTK